MDPFVAFGGAYFFVTTNNPHPTLVKDQSELSKEEQYDRAALNARLKKHEFCLSYTNKSKLPFTALEIALALEYLVDVME